MHNGYGVAAAHLYDDTVIRLAVTRPLSPRGIYDRGMSLVASGWYLNPCNPCNLCKPGTPVFRVMSAVDEFYDKTTAPN